MAHYKILPLLLFILAASSSCIKNDDDGPTENYIKTGDKLPVFTFYDAEGDPVSSLRLQGKPSFIIFFMSTCPQCDKSMDKVLELWDLLDSGYAGFFNFVPISRQESPDEVLSYMSDRGLLRMPVYFDPDRSAFDMFANRTVPRMYVTDTLNTVVWMEEGGISRSAAELYDIILSAGASK